MEAGLSGVERDYLAGKLSSWRAYSAMRHGVEAELATASIAGEQSGGSKDANEGSLTDLAIQIMTSLPEADQRIIELLYLRRRPLSEVAEELKLSPAIVRLRVIRALHRLRTQLMKADAEIRAAAR